MAETKVDRDGLIATSNRLFVEVKQIGHLDEKGKTLLSLGYKGKMEGKADHPLMTLLVPLINEIAPLLRYSSQEAADKDLADFQGWVEGLGFEEP